MSSAMVRRAGGPEAEATLAEIRSLRNDHIVHAPHGKEFTQLVESFGPVLTEAIRVERDGKELRGKVSQFLLTNFKKGANLEALAREISEPSTRAVSLLSAVSKRKRSEGDIERLRARAVRFIREEVKEGANFQTVMTSLNRMLKEEEENLGKHGR